MYDHQTESLWSHVTGKAIKGPLEGTSLETYPVTQTTWQSWQEMHPDTKTLAKPKLSQSHYASYNANPEKMGIFGRQLKRSQLPGKTKIIGFQLNRDSYAVPIEELSPDSVEEIIIADIPLLIYTDKSGEGVYVWSPRKNGRPVDITIRNATGFRIETESGAAINLVTGQSESQDIRLQRIQTTQAFWFGWHNFYPETEVIHVESE